MFYETKDLQNHELKLTLLEARPADPVRGLVPMYRFAICRLDGTAVGALDFRLGKDTLLYYAGQIGYRVEAPYRGNHYAEKAVTLLFPLAEKHGYDHLLITCNPDNTPSRRTCERLGGILLEIADLPEDTDMYARGERKKCIFRVNIKKRTDQ